MESPQPPLQDAPSWSLGKGETMKIYEDYKNVRVQKRGGECLQEGNGAPIIGSFTAECTTGDELFQSCLEKQCLECSVPAPRCQLRRLSAGDCFASAKFNPADAPG